MNVFMGKGHKGWNDTHLQDEEVLTMLRVYVRQNQFINLPPSQAWLITDQHPDSILFATMYQDAYPANYHQGGTTFLYADGHTEVKRWQDPVYKQGVKYTSWAPAHKMASRSSPDYRWIFNRMTEVPNGFEARPGDPEQ